MATQSVLAAVDHLRHALKAAGYAIVPVKTKQKVPSGFAWQTVARRGEVPRATVTTLNTGILCDGLRVIDIDIDDVDVVEAVAQVARELLGNAPARTRSNSGRMTLVYRAAEGQPKKRIIDGTAGKVGLTSGQNSNMGTVNSVAGQYGSMANSLSGPSAAQTGYGTMYDAAGNPSLTESTLMDTAIGKNLGTQADGYQTLRNNVANDTMTSINALFNNSGRFGGGSHQEDLSEGLGNALGALDYQQYNNALDRQNQALSSIEQQRQQGFQNQFNSLGAEDAARLSQLGAQSSALGNQASLANTAFGMGQQGTANASAAANNAGALWQNGQLPTQTQLGAGQALDADAQAKLMGDYDLSERQNNAGWDQISKALGLLNSGTGSGNVQKPSNPFLDALGIGGTLLGAFL